MPEVAGHEPWIHAGSSSSSKGGAAAGQAKQRPARLALAECSEAPLPLGESPPLLLGLPSPLLAGLPAVPVPCGTPFPFAAPAAPADTVAGWSGALPAASPAAAEEAAAAAAATAAGPAGSSPLAPAPVWSGVPHGCVLYTMRCSAVSSMMLGMKQGSAFSPATDTPMAAARSRTCAGRQRGGPGLHERG